MTPTPGGSGELCPCLPGEVAGPAERQLGGSMALIVNYNGALTRRITLAHNLSFVPAAYFTGGNVLNPNTAALNANATNPFLHLQLYILADEQPGCLQQCHR